MPVIVRYEGQRDGQGYSEYYDDDPDNGGQCIEIRERGGPKISVIIDGNAPCLFEEISKIDMRDPSEIRGFCDLYGLPSSDSEMMSLQFLRALLSDLMSLIQKAHAIDLIKDRNNDWALIEQEATELLNRHELKSPEHFELKRVPGTKAPQLVAVTRNPFSFAVLQLCAAVSERQEIKKCAHEACGGYFPAGGTSGRKRDGVYCSTRCRVAAHRAKK